jgi:hypothetical protein
LQMQRLFLVWVWVEQALIAGIGPYVIAHVVLDLLGDEQPKEFDLVICQLFGVGEKP